MEPIMICILKDMCLMKNQKPQEKCVDCQRSFHAKCTKKNFPDSDGQHCHQCSMVCPYCLAVLSCSTFEITSEHITNILNKYAHNYDIYMRFIIALQRN